MSFHADSAALHTKQPDSRSAMQRAVDAGYAMDSEDIWTVASAEERLRKEQPGLWACVMLESVAPVNKGPKPPTSDHRIGGALVHSK